MSASKTGAGEELFDVQLHFQIIPSNNKGSSLWLEIYWLVVKTELNKTNKQTHKQANKQPDEMFVKIPLLLFLKYLTDWSRK